MAQGAGAVYKEIMIAHLKGHNLKSFGLVILFVRNRRKGAEKWLIPLQGKKQIREV